MTNFEIRTHKVKGLKGGVNLVVWYKGKFQRDFIRTVYPSQLSIIDFFKLELKDDFEKHLNSKLQIIFDEVVS